MQKKLIKKIATKVLRPIALRYISKDRVYRNRGIVLLIKKGVFHPGLFFSTKLYATWLCKMGLEGKSVLEIGTGSGFLGLVMAREGAFVTVTDINPLAIETVKHNAIANKLPLTIIQSDLFDEITPDQYFDYIVVSPPYYPNDPQNDQEKAWFCGSNFQYFVKFFGQLSQKIQNATCYMILSDDCNIDHIRHLANESGLSFDLVFERKVYWEYNYIFEIRPVLPDFSLQ